MNTFYHGDCKFVMEHDIEPNSIDLIYLDPPFFTGKIQKGIAKWQPGAMEVSYEDSKKFWGDTEKVNAMRTKSPEWLRHIAQTRPDFASYLFYMMKRLEACHKVLKDTGSIYLHCDEKASHYLKMIMDEIFGDNNFRNEIIWCYKGGNATNKFRKKHDVILFYTKNEQYYFNADATRRPYSPKILSIAKKDTEGNLYYETGQNKEGKVYLHSKGQLPYDWWDDIPSSTSSHGKERVGYPTQKPLALLERIIKASSNGGDTILDPFCGCGTAIIAAHNLRRYWIGIDISKDAYDVTITRKAKAAQHRQGMDDTFSYMERTLPDVLAIEKPIEFERWVNGFFKAHKPSPDKGVDGITPDNIPIQTKTFKVTYTYVSKLVADAKYHPQVKQPFDHAIIVSQVGFDDGARQRQFEIQTKENIQVDLLTPSIMLDKEGKK